MLAFFPFPPPVPRLNHEALSRSWLCTLTQLPIPTLTPSKLSTLHPVPEPVVVSQFGQMSDAEVK